MALETPPPFFMANTILNFHFDYLHPSLSLKVKTVGHRKQLQTTWCDPQTIVSKCWVTSKTYHYVLFFVGHYCFQVPHAPALSGTRKTNTFKIVEMTNFSTVCIGKKYISSCDTNKSFLICEPCPPVTGDHEGDSR